MTATLTLKPRKCQHCGATYAPNGPVKNQSKFCSPEHRFAWDRVRKSRGADLYDLFMNQRFNRAEANEAELWSLMCRMASKWKEQDGETVSYCDDVRELRMRHNAAAATVVNRNAAGNKRRAA